jgi:ParB family chromosome partitioning protein
MATKVKESKQETTSPAGGEAAVIKHVALESLYHNPYQPKGRIEVPEDTAKQFGLSILEHGLIQTPVGRQLDGPGRYEVGDGWLRLAGFKWLVDHGHPEYAEIPLQVKALTDQQMADLVMEANTIRKDLDPIDLARFYKRYLEDFGITQAELARRHNCSQGEIANTLRLLDLPETVQQKVISREITETHGRQLLRLNYNTELQSKVLGETIKEGYSVNRLSDQVASSMYRQSENLDPNDYPKPGFDVKDCEKCTSRQKIGSPYSNEKKTWRCLDKACYEKKTKQAEQARVDKLAADLAAARKDAGDKKKDKVLDLQKLTWRDYQELDCKYHKIDNPKECGTCPRRALGKLYTGKTEMVCVDVKCFKAKEQAYQNKEAARAKEAERKLTERVKEACDNLSDEAAAFRLFSDYLLSHCRKDTREKVARMYGIKEPELAGLFTAGSDDVQRKQSRFKIVALVLQAERYEGVAGQFKRMLAVLEGNSEEIEKKLAAFLAAHCNNCRHDSGGCKTLLKVYEEGKCYAHWKKPADDKAGDEGEGDEEEGEESPSTAPEEFGLDQGWVCRVCGCTDEHACETEDGPCHWAEPNLCSACVGKEVKPAAPAKEKCPDEKNGKCSVTNRNCEDYYRGKCLRVKKSEAVSKDIFADLVIHTATAAGKPHVFKIGKLEINGGTLRECAIALVNQLKITESKSPEEIIKALKTLPATPKVAILIGVLEGKK